MELRTPPPIWKGSRDTEVIAYPPNYPGTNEQGTTRFQTLEDTVSGSWGGREAGMLAFTDRPPKPFTAVHVLSPRLARATDHEHAFPRSSSTKHQRW